jgi:CubicO group peptidase (beta-lactamase class C family)
MKIPAAHLDKIPVATQRAIEFSNSPGASFALSYKGTLLCRGGLGFTDRDGQTAVTPDHLFRIASLSKPITSTAILLLAERGLLDLDTPVVDVLAPDSERVRDSPMRAITLRHLADLRSGLEYRHGCMSNWAASRRQVPLGPNDRVTIEETIEYWAEQIAPGKTPGVDVVWDAASYTTLGRVIEKVTGQPYEAFIKDQLLKPCGTERMELGAAQPAYRRPGEVSYYAPDEGLFPAIPALGLSEPTPRAYGDIVLQMYDSNSGWLATPTDYMRFMDVYFGYRQGPLRKPPFLTALSVHAPSDVAQQSDHYSYNAFGWTVRNFGLQDPQALQQPSHFSCHFAAAVHGATAVCVKTEEDFVYLAYFNISRDDPRLQGSAISEFWKVYEDFLSGITAEFGTIDAFIDAGREQGAFPAG